MNIEKIVKIIDKNLKEQNKYMHFLLLDDLNCNHFDIKKMKMSKQDESEEIRNFLNNSEIKIENKKYYKIYTNNLSFYSQDFCNHAILANIIMMDNTGELLMLFFYRNIEPKIIRKQIVFPKIGKKPLNTEYFLELVQSKDYRINAGLKYGFHMSFEFMSYDKIKAVFYEPQIRNKILDLFYKENEGIKKENNNQLSLEINVVGDFSWENTIKYIKLLITDYFNDNGSNVKRRADIIYYLNTNTSSILKEIGYINKLPENEKKELLNFFEKNKTNVDLIVESLDISKSRLSNKLVRNPNNKAFDLDFGASKIKSIINMIKFNLLLNEEIEKPAITTKPNRNKI